MTARPRLLRPFLAERYTRELDLSRLISPPYDVISPDRRSALARDPHNIVHLTLPDSQGDRYAHAAALLDRWRETGVLVADKQPTVSILRQRFIAEDGKEHERTGLIAGVTAEPYRKGRVRPHERTHRGPKEDRLALLRATDATLEPLLFLSRDEEGSLRSCLAAETQRPPDTQTHIDDVGISLWIVGSGAAEEALQTLCREPLYIADGHHRYETAAAHGAERPDEGWTLGLVVAVGDPGLVVLPTHRVIVDVSSTQVDFERLLNPVGDAPDGAADCTLVLPGGVERALRLPRSEPSAAEGLELLIERVERMVVAPLLSSSGGRLVYTHDAGAARRFAARGAISVLVHPTAVEDVLAVADAGGVMPPKSTFFYPKVPSGLVVASLS